MAISLLCLVAAQAGAQLSEGHEAYERGDYLAAAQALRQAAAQGDAEAQLMLGDLHASGKGVPQNDEEAVQWYCRAVEQGHVPARERLEGMRWRFRLNLRTRTVEEACAEVLRPVPRSETPADERDRTYVDITVNVYPEAVAEPYPGATPYYGYPTAWLPLGARPFRPFLRASPDRFHHRSRPLRFERAPQRPRLAVPPGVTGFGVLERPSRQPL